MSFINFRFIHVDPLDDSAMSTEQIQVEHQSRYASIIRALEMANSVIDRNRDVLAYYWYLWTCRDRIYPEGFQGQRMTRGMVKQLTIPTEQQQLLLKQHLQLFVVFVHNKVLVKHNKILYAHTDPIAQPPPRSNQQGRKRPFLTVFRMFHRHSITVIFHRT
jgi:hypothetical protein